RRVAGGGGGALGRPAGHADGAAVVAYDAVGDPQPQPGALLAIALGGKERLEDVRQVLLGDAAAGIAHRNVHRVAAEQLGIGVVGVASADVDRAAVGHRLLRVEQEVQDDLL